MGLLDSIAAFLSQDQTQKSVFDKGKDDPNSVKMMLRGLLNNALVNTVDAPASLWNAGWGRIIGKEAPTLSGAIPGLRGAGAAYDFGGSLGDAGMWTAALRGIPTPANSGASRGTLASPNQVGAIGTRAKTEYELAHEVAQRNAALPVEQGGLGLPPGNTAMERARAMGWDTPGYHGGTSDITEVLPEKFGSSDYGYAGRGFYTSSGPSGANVYGNREGGSVYPVLVKTKDHITRTKQNWQDPSIPNPYREIPDIAQQSGAKYPTNSDLAEASKKWTDEMRKRGFTGFTDAATDGSEMVSFLPQNIRSRFAAFDPFKRDSADLLAGLAGAGLLSPILIDALKERQ